MAPDRQDSCKNRRQTGPLPSGECPLQSGPAVLRKDGRSYLADHAEYDGRAVAATVRLRHRDLLGERLYPPRSIVWPITRVEVEWLGTER